MELKWERQHGFDHELVWGCIGLAAALAAAVLPVDRLLARIGYRCPFRDLAGVPCLTCGATRAFVAMASLHPREALRLNPLAAIFFAGLCLYTLWALGSVLLGSKRLRIHNVSRREKLCALLAGSIMAIGNWIYLIATSGRHP